MKTVKKKWNNRWWRKCIEERKEREKSQIELGKHEEGKDGRNKESKDEEKETRVARG